MGEKVDVERLIKENEELKKTLEEKEKMIEEQEQEIDNLRELYTINF